MAWTTPRTWASGEYLTAALLNEQLRDNMNALRIGFGTSFPGSPAEGDLYCLTDSTSAPTYRWLFRYNAGSGSSYKWEAIGPGTPVVNVVETSESTSSSSYADLSTGGPSFTVPRAGDYLVTVAAAMAGYVDNGGTGQSIRMSFQVGGTGASDADCAAKAADSYAGSTTPSSTRVKTGLAASTALTAKYRRDQNGTNSLGYWSGRRLLVAPMRCS